MKIVRKLRGDSEYQELRKRYEAKFGKRPPGFNFDEYAGLEDYKQYIRKCIEEGKAEIETAQSIWAQERFL